jgi:hypothetical protein
VLRNARRVARSTYLRDNQALIRSASADLRIGGFLKSFRRCDPAPTSPTHRVSRIIFDLTAVAASGTQPSRSRRVCDMNPCPFISQMRAA